MKQKDNLQKALKDLQTAVTGSTPSAQEKDTVQDLNAQLDKLRRQSTQKNGK